MRCLFGLLLFLTGCSAILRDYSTQHNIEPTRPLISSELRMELRAEPLILSFGDTLSIVLAVSNDSNQPFSKGFSSGCVYGYGLWNTESVLVAPPVRICTMNAPIIRYKPGEARTIKFNWIWNNPNVGSGKYDLYCGFGPRGEYESAPPVTVRLK